MFGGSISYLSHQILSSSSIAAAWLGLFAHRYFYLATNTKRAFYPIQTIVRGKLIAFDVFVEIAVFRFAFTGQSARREKWRGLMDNLGKYLSHIIWLQKHLNFWGYFDHSQSRSGSTPGAAILSLREYSQKYYTRLAGVLPKSTPSLWF